MSSFSRPIKIAVFSACFALLLIRGISAYATPPEMQGSGQPVPRFVTIASDKAFIRTGPAQRYPIKWVYRKTGLPVEVTQEFDVWRKIRDSDGEEGWINRALLSERRGVIVQGGEPVPLYSHAGNDGRLIARAEPGVVAVLQSCSAGQCRISTGGYQGWVDRKLLWGLYPDEEIK